MRPASRGVLIAIAGGAVGVVAPIVVAGCMGEGTTCPAPDASAGPDAKVDAPLDVGSDGKQAAPAGLRLANLSPSAPPVDFCIAKCPPAGCVGQLPASAFQGPLLADFGAALFDAGFPVDAGAEGLVYPQVSAYVPVASFRSFAVRIVVGGSPDCAAGIVRDLTDLPVLGSGAVSTIALIGEAQPEAQPTATLQAISLPDDATQRVPDGGAPKIYLRFLHAAPGLSTSPLSMLLDTVGKAPKVVFSDVAFGKTGAASSGPDAGPKVGVNGYLATDPCAPNVSSCPSVSVERSGADAATPLAAGTFPAAAGSVITLVLVGDTPATDAGAAAGEPFQLLECVDNAATANILGSCSLLSSSTSSP